MDTKTVDSKDYSFIASYLTLCYSLYAPFSLYWLFSRCTISSSGLCIIQRLARSTIWSKSGIDHHSSSNENSVAPLIKTSGVIETNVQIKRLSRPIRVVSLMIAIPIANEIKDNIVAAAGDVLSRKNCDGSSWLSGNDPGFDALLYHVYVANARCLIIHHHYKIAISGSGLDRTRWWHLSLWG